MQKIKLFDAMSLDERDDLHKTALPAIACYSQETAQGVDYLVAQSMKVKVITLLQYEPSFAISGRGSDDATQVQAFRRRKNDDVRLTWQRCHNFGPLGI